MSFHITFMKLEQSNNIVPTFLNDCNIVKQTINLLFSNITK